ncbi:hypothetical protein Nepgr_030078 [Nepenthes gracilis]|uniref:Uncharacterized protein n=1 Tax=Nepenthes gracilis TaxID=150966 RepID=A0AAD3TDW7_NEPGR|nr:hypothetical protein Nepgr_030078 [Nepenthes gracilis]
MMLLAASALRVAAEHVEVLYVELLILLKGPWSCMAFVWSWVSTPRLYRMAADVGLLAFHPHFLCGWYGFDLLETAVLAAGKIQCLLLILAAVGSVSEG